MYNIGVFWGIALYIIWMGIFWMWIPKHFRDKIFSWKYGPLLFDFTITGIGGSAIGGSSIVAGIATVTFGLLCFITTAIVCKCIQIKTGWKAHKLAKGKI